MGKLLKWLVRSALTSLILALAAIIYLLVAVDPNDYKPQIKNLAAKQGLELSLDKEGAGDLAWQFFPQIGIKIEQVEFAYANSTSSSAVNSASGNIGQLTLAINWRDLLKLIQASNQLPLGTIKIGDSNIRIEPIAPNKLPIELDSVNAVISNFSIQGERFPLSFSARALGAIDLALTANVALNITDNRRLQEVSLEDINLIINQLEVQGYLNAGNGNDQGLTTAEGTLQSNSLNLKQQLIELQKTFPAIQLPEMASKDALTALSFNSSFNLDSNGISTIATQLDIDNQPLTVDTEITHSSSNLYLSISGDSFDIANYLATEAAPSTQNNALFAPLALPFALWMGRSQLELSLGELNFGDFAAGNIYLNLFGNQNVLQLSSFNADIFDGQVNATGRVDMRSATPVFELQNSLTNIDLQLALPAIADSSDLSGLLSLNADLQGAGNNSDEILQALTGKGDLTVLSPSYLAINAEETFCNAAALFGGSTTNTTWSKGTELDTINSQFSLNNGKVLIRDLETGTGNLSINGRGTVQLLLKRYSITANTRVNGSTTSPAGCSVNKSLRNRNLPFICTGSYDTNGKTNCKPDDSLVRDFLKGSVFEQLGGQLFDTPVTDKDSDGEQEQDPFKNLLKGILEKKLK